MKKNKNNQNGQQDKKPGQTPQGNENKANEKLNERGNDQWLAGDNNAQRESITFVFYLN